MTNSELGDKIVIDDELLFEWRRAEIVVWSYRPLSNFGVENFKRAVIGIYGNNIINMLPHLEGIWPIDAVFTTFGLGGRIQILDEEREDIYRILLLEGIRRSYFDPNIIVKENFRDYEW